MPAKMHSFYLRECWLANSLANDRMVLAGERLLVSRIDVDSYIVAAIDDHIVPWRSSYKTTQILKGECRFALSSAGHIAGIVNPPSPKAKLWTNDELPTDADEWLSGAKRVRGNLVERLDFVGDPSLGWAQGARPYGQRQVPRDRGRPRAGT